MKIINADVEFITPIDGGNHSEAAGTVWASVL